MPAEKRCGTCHYCEVEPDPGTYGTCVWGHSGRLPVWMQPNNDDGVDLYDGKNCPCWEPKKEAKRG